MEGGLYLAADPFSAISTFDRGLDDGFVAHRVIDTGYHIQCQPDSKEVNDLIEEGAMHVSDYVLLSRGEDEQGVDRAYP